MAIDIDPACVAGTEITQRANANVSVLEMPMPALSIPPRSASPRDGSPPGNLPYQLTGLVLMRLVEAAEPPARAVVLVQREVAARLAAEPGDWSLATVAIRSLAEVERHPRRAAERVRPAARGALVDHPDRSRRRRQIRRSAGAVLALAKPLFQSRRKTLAQRRERGRSAATLAGAGVALADAGIDPGRRPGTLAPR